MRISRDCLFQTHTISSIRSSHKFSSLAKFHFKKTFLKFKNLIYAEKNSDRKKWKTLEKVISSFFSLSLAHSRDHRAWLCYLFFLASSTSSFCCFFHLCFRCYFFTVTITIVLWIFIHIFFLLMRVVLFM